MVTGCAAQLDPQAFAEMPEVDCVVGNAEKYTANAFAKRYNCMIGGFAGIRAKYQLFLITIPEIEAYPVIIVNIVF